MSTVYQNIAVVGAGGNLGPFTIKALVAENFNVTVLSRASSQATFPASVRVLKGEYTPEFFVSALKGQDAVVMTVSSSALAEQRAIIEAAAVAGIKRIIPSEFGSDTMNPLVVHAVPVFQGKVEIVDYLKLVSAKNPQLTWTAIINGPFFDWCLKHGFYGFDLAKHTAILYDHGVAKFDTTTISTVGASVAKVLLHPDMYQNECVYVSSFTTSQQEILEALRDVTKDSNWTTKEESSHAFQAGGLEKLARGDYEGILDLIFAATFQEGNGANYSSIRKIANAELGLPKEDLLAVTKEVVETDRHIVKW
ncbi:hypothetical protein V1522DRAFT_280452 [Lipomyces starkeyi]